MTRLNRLLAGLIAGWMLLFLFATFAHGKTKTKAAYIPLGCITRITVVKWGDCTLLGDGRTQCSKAQVIVSNACTTYTKPPRETAVIPKVETPVEK